MTTAIQEPLTATLTDLARQAITSANGNTKIASAKLAARVRTDDNLFLSVIDLVIAATVEAEAAGPVSNRSEPLLNEREAASFLGISPRTLQEWRCKNQGPAFSRVGSLVRYEPTVLERWVRLQREHHRSAGRPGPVTLPGGLRGQL